MVSQGSGPSLSAGISLNPTFLLSLSVTISATTSSHPNPCAVVMTADAPARLSLDTRPPSLPDAQPRAPASTYFSPRFRRTARRCAQGKDGGGRRVAHGPSTRTHVALCLPPRNPAVGPPTASEPSPSFPPLTFTIGHTCRCKPAGWRAAIWKSGKSRVQIPLSPSPLTAGRSSRLPCVAPLPRSSVLTHRIGQSLEPSTFAAPPRVLGQRALDSRRWRLGGPAPFARRPAAPPGTTSR